MDLLKYIAGKIAYLIFSIFFLAFVVTGMGTAMEMQKHVPVSLFFIMYDILVLMFFATVLLTSPRRPMWTSKRYIFGGSAIIAVLGYLLYFFYFYELMCNFIFAKDGEPEVPWCIEELNSRYDTRFHAIWELVIA